MIFLSIVCVVLAICLWNTWAEKEHWLKMYILEKQKGYPEMWYCGKDGEWIASDS